MGVTAGECVYQEPPRSSYIIIVPLGVDPRVTETLGSSHTRQFLFPTHVKTFIASVLQSSHTVHLTVL